MKNTRFQITFIFLILFSTYAGAAQAETGDYNVHLEIAPGFAVAGWQAEELDPGISIAGRFEYAFMEWNRVHEVFRYISEESGLRGEQAGGFEIAA